MSFDLYIKFLLFYFELCKRLIQRLLQLHNRALKAVLGYFEKNFVPDVDYNPQQHKELLPLDKLAQRILSETAEDFYSTIAMVMKFMNEKLGEMITTYPVEAISIPQFHKLQAFFEDARRYFDNQIQIGQSVSEWLKTDNQLILAIVNKVKAGYMDKITVNQLMSLKSECEKSKLSFYHILT